MYRFSYAREHVASAGITNIAKYTARIVIRGAILRLVSRIPPYRVHYRQDEGVRVELTQPGSGPYNKSRTRRYKWMFEEVCEEP